MHRFLLIALAVLGVCAVAAPLPPIDLVNGVAVFERIPASADNQTQLFRLQPLAPPSFATLLFSSAGAPYSASLVSPSQLPPPSPFAVVTLLEDAVQGPVVLAVRGQDDKNAAAFSVRGIAQRFASLPLDGSSTAERVLNASGAPFAGLTFALDNTLVTRFPAYVSLVSEGSEDVRCEMNAAAMRVALNVVPKDFEHEHRPAPPLGVWELNLEASSDLGLMLPVQTASALGEYYVSLGWQQSNCETNVRFALLLSARNVN